MITTGQVCFMTEKTITSQKLITYILLTVLTGRFFWWWIDLINHVRQNITGTIEFAIATSMLKHSIEGGYNRVSVADVEKLAGGDGSGIGQR